MEIEEIKPSYIKRTPLSMIITSVHNKSTCGFSVRLTSYMFLADKADASQLDYPIILSDRIICDSHFERENISSIEYV